MQKDPRHMGLHVVGEFGEREKHNSAFTTALENLRDFHSAGALWPCCLCGCHKLLVPGILGESASALRDPLKTQEVLRGAVHGWSKGTCSPTVPGHLGASIRQTCSLGCNQLYPSTLEPTCEEP